MKNLRSKMKKQGGFTLIEMLIVVAIIAILVAVSIPIVNSALEKTRVATDAANERAAKAAFMVAYLMEQGPEVDGLKRIKVGTTYYYEAEKGVLSVDAPTTGYGYGKCTSGHSGSKGHAGGYITLKMETNGDVTLTWSAGTGLHNATVADN